MKITYTPNPLLTSVELDEHEKREMWHRIRFEQMLDMLFTVHFELACKGDKEPDLERLKKEADPDYYLNDAEGHTDKTRLDLRCDELLEYYLAELKGQHVGDCTCVACSCSKCNAEGMLGIDTLKPFPGKHPMNKIANAFSRWNPETKQHDGPEVTLDEAITKLAEYDPKPSTGSGWEKVGGYEAHIPRWKEEAAAATIWLRNYRDQHFTSHE
jgi:hypothetical protein